MMECKSIAIPQTGGCEVSEQSNIKQIVVPQTLLDKEAQMLDAAIKYTRYLRLKHPGWSPSKIQRRVGAHFQIKFV